MARPYQPSLLRSLHGTTALLVLACWGSGLLVYNRYDGRWGRLPFELGGDWIDLHGSFGVALWPLALLFALYSVTIGARRLRRPANAAALLALALAVGSGKLMQEDWLRQGQLHHLVYGLHLLAWLVISAAVLGHLVSVLGTGGIPLARSMFSLRNRPGDQPCDWLGQMKRQFTGGR